MSDLVKRLREADRGYTPGTMFSEAADRIEELEGQLDLALEQRDKWCDRAMRELGEQLDAKAREASQ